MLPATALTAAWQPWEGATGSKVAFRVHDITNDTRFAPAIDLACYRIVQEAISNATRHGHARHVDVELSIEADGLCLTITDDGIGFDPTTIYPHDGEGGFGIIGMRERVRLLNGHLEVLSAPCAGTQVFAIIPLDVKGLFILYISISNMHQEENTLVCYNNSRALHLNFSLYLPLVMKTKKKMLKLARQGPRPPGGGAGSL